MNIVESDNSFAVVCGESDLRDIFETLCSSVSISPEDCWRQLRQALINYTAEVSLTDSSGELVTKSGGVWSLVCDWVVQRLGRSLSAVISRHSALPFESSPKLSGRLHATDDGFFDIFLGWSDISLGMIWEVAAHDDGELVVELKAKWFAGGPPDLEHEIDKVLEPFWTGDFLALSPTLTAAVWEAIFATSPDKNRLGCGCEVSRVGSILRVWLPDDEVRRDLVEMLSPYCGGD